MTLKIVTIGVYGSTEEAFFNALRETGVDTFCDIRLRRGMRGSVYAFANSARLQKRLGEMGIRYLHFKELAPTKEIREHQARADKKSGTGKRKRTELAEPFVQAYRDEVLADFDSQAFVEKLGADAHVVCLFCVEGAPEACHRSLLAERLEQDLRIHVEHLRA
jgi:uncharacterized protein (DUF488 family)